MFLCFLRSMRTTLCCEVQPAVVAVGSIFLAACDLNIPLAKETGWYELFDVTWDDVVKVCTRILSLYKREPPKYLKLAEKVAVLPKVEKERMHARIERDNDKMEEDTTEADEDAKPASAAASAPSAAGSAAAAAAASDAAAPVRAEGESVKENVAAAEGQSQSEVLNDGKAEQPQQLHHRHRHHPQTRQTAREPPHAPKRKQQEFLLLAFMYLKHYFTLFFKEGRHAKFYRIVLLLLVHFCSFAFFLC